MNEERLQVVTEVQPSWPRLRRRIARSIKAAAAVLIVGTILGGVGTGILLEGFAAAGEPLDRDLVVGVATVCLAGGVIAALVERSAR